MARVVRRNHAAEFGRAVQPIEHLVGRVTDANDRFPAVPLVALGDIPLAVLSHDPEKLYVALGFSADLAKGMNRQWEEMQGELAQLSTDASRLIAKGSGHMIHQERPELVIEAVKKLVEQTRWRGSP